MNNLIGDPNPLIRKLFPRLISNLNSPLNSPAKAIRFDQFHSNISPFILISILLQSLYDITWNFPRKNISTGTRDVFFWDWSRCAKLCWIWGSNAHNLQKLSIVFTGQISLLDRGLLYMFQNLQLYSWIFIKVHNSVIVGHTNQAMITIYLLMPVIIIRNLTFIISLVINQSWNVFLDLRMVIQIYKL